MRLMPRTLFSKIFIWSAFAQVLTLGSLLALVSYYIPDSEGAINNAWSAYAHTAVVLVALDATVKNTNAPDGRLSHYRIQVSLTRDAGSGRWLVSQLQFVG